MSPSNLIFFNTDFNFMIKTKSFRDINMSKDIGMFKGDEWFTRKILLQKLTIS